MVAVCFVMTSCYTFTAVVGEGPKTGEVVTQKNHYVVNGLAKLKTADTQAMAGGAKDYSITITHSFIDGLISTLTGGIYTPTSVSVTK